MNMKDKETFAPATKMVHNTAVLLIALNKIGNVQMQHPFSCPLNLNSPNKYRVFYTVTDSSREPSVWWVKTHETTATETPLVVRCACACVQSVFIQDRKKSRRARKRI
jgi:hypothetical protein